MMTDRNSAVHSGMLNVKSNVDYVAKWLSEKSFKNDAFFSKISKKINAVQRALVDVMDSDDEDSDEEDDAVVVPADSSSDSESVVGLPADSSSDEEVTTQR